MNFEANIPDLIRWFSFVRQASATKIARPILKNVLLTVKGEQLYLRATDGDLELSAFMPVEVKEEGSFAVDTLVISPMQFFKQTEPVIIKVDGRSVVVSQGNRVHKFACLDSVEFPEERTIKEYTRVTNPARLVQILKVCDTSYSRLARRKILQSYSINPHICATLPDTAGSFIIAGDGNRLVCFEGIQDINLDSFPIFGNIATPKGENFTEVLGEISKLTDKDELYLQFGQVSGIKAKVWNEESKDFTHGWEMKTTSQKGEYPTEVFDTLRKHTKADHFFTATIDKQELKEKLQVCQIYLTEAKSQGFGEGTDLIVKDGHLTFEMAIDNNSIQMHEPVEAKKVETQGDLQVKFHSKDLLDLVEQAEEGELFLKMTTDKGPLILLDSDEQKYYIQGPLV